MKLYNYLRVLGTCLDAQQCIELDLEPKDRQERKMLEEARQLIENSWLRRKDRLAASSEPVDLDAERAAFFPKQHEGKVLMPLQYIQDFLVRRIAAVQNNACIHDTKSVKEVTEVFNEYGVVTRSTFENLVFSNISWANRPGQKPKLMVHAKEGDDDVCIRFEAAQELCQKFLNAMLALDLREGQTFSLSVCAVDPAIERNAKAGKKVAEPGKFVNHNLKLSVDARSHEGRPPNGERFVQKPTLEFMEVLFKQALAQSGKPQSGKRV